MPSVRVESFQFFNVPMRTRMPFRYGIATLTELPHLLVRAETSDGVGWAAEGLAPKWFTKNPAIPPSEDIAEMLRVIRTAFQIAVAAGEAPTPFDLWRRIYDQQMAWAAANAIPPLLANFGVSLVERTIIDAFCRANRLTFADAVRSNALGIRLSEVHAELNGANPADLLPATPRRSIILRHTIGLSDPLSADEITDGLPHSLESCVREYGLTHFKIKLSGDLPFDIERLGAITSLLERISPSYRFTLDGNENFSALDPVIELLAHVNKSRLLFIEQPLHRDVALSHPVPRDVPIIIDESDATLTSLPEALRLGYAGTSHKNCKGIFKGIANACLIAHRGGILSGEDLTTVAPVALPQDLAVLATLGVEHAERNGHHYFRGLSAFPQRVQDRVIAAHPDLYHRHEGGFATLTIRDGRIATASCVDAPFGVAADLDPADFTPLESPRAMS